MWPNLQETVKVLWKTSLFVQWILKCHSLKRFLMDCCSLRWTKYKEALFIYDYQLLTPFSSISRSSHRRCSVKKGALKNFAKFTEKKYLCQSLIFNKAVGLRPATLLKKRLWQRCFPMNFAWFLRAPFLENS